MCFFFHQALGNKDLAFTSVVYGLNPKTIEGWCTKSSMIKIWRDFAKTITVSQILHGLSTRWRNSEAFRSISKDVLDSPVPSKNFPHVAKDCFQKQAIFHTSGYVLFQEKLAMALNRPESYCYINKGVFVLQQKPSKYHAEEISVRH